MQLLLIVVSFFWVGATAIALFLARLAGLKAPAPDEQASEPPDT